MEQEQSERQHNEDERDDESQRHEEYVEFWRRQRMINFIATVTMWDCIFPFKTCLC